MTYIPLSADPVECIHDAILNPGEIKGIAGDKSLASALARFDNRLIYGMIDDAFDLAATHCVAVATGHVFNDGIKPTAHQVMDVCLDMNAIQLEHGTVEVDNLIRDAPKAA